MYIEEIKKTQGGKIYHSVLVRENYREDGKVKHRTVANISHLPAAIVKQLKSLLSGKGKLVNSDDLDLLNCREYGASSAFLDLARELELDKMLYSRKVQWREDLMALTVGRIVYQGSKLQLSNLFNDTALWELCGHDAGKNIAVNTHCYLPMDELLDRQDKIQKALAKKHLDNGCLILYDITNTWLEGEYKDSDLVAYGKAKGGKRGYKQVALGLITNREGCPVAVEVFKGNTSDQATVWGQAKVLAESYGVSEVIFAGDRGMLTPKRIEEVSSFGFKTLTALTHPQIRQLLEKQVLQPELFDERNIIEVTDPEQPGVRFMLCKNPETLRRSRETRQNLINLTCEALDKIKQSKRKSDRDAKCARIGKVLAKYCVEKFFEWELDEKDNLIYSLNEEKISKEAALDGCYIVRTDAGKEIFNKDEAVAGYKQLTQVEQAFRNMKTVSLELRPIYHKTDDRIKAHVFLCMLSYYVQWHAMQRLKPLFNADGEGANRRWTFESVVEHLKSIRKIEFGLKGVSLNSKVSQPNPDQAKIIKLLKGQEK